MYNKAKKNPGKRFKKLKKLLLKDEVLYTAWENLNRNTKSTGLDSLTIKQVEASGADNFIRSVKKELKQDRYTVGKVKRVEIP